MISLNEAEDFQKVQDIFAAALDLAPEDRSAFLAQTGAGATTLAEVESLLRARDEAGDFLKNISAADALHNFADATDCYIGRKIKDYRLARELGRGGMGVVFLVTREDFRQQAALKIIKRGMDSDAILERFTREREILAQLNHPFIAHLLDGGTTEDGSPFFVMEYVEGVPVDEFCRRENLSPKETLALFRKICEAVSFAHQKLIVHRDLKPSNILICDDGTPKLLDFGIAKLLAGEAANQTRTEQRALTPAYASPEQMRGEIISTTSDVYSLGVILAELLNASGTARQKKTDPNRSPHETIDDVEKNANLDRDLKTILQTAVRQEAERRYQSVVQFSEDVRHYLDDLPIAARKDSISYRATKFVQRNRVAAVIALLFVLSLIGGLAATVWQYRRAQIAQARAERRFQDVRRLADSFVFELNDEISRSPTGARALLVRRALEYLDSLAAESAGDAELQRDLAAAYMKLGDIQSTAYVANVGDTAGAIQSYGKAVSLLDALNADHPNEPEYLKLLSDAEEGLGKRQSLTEDTDAAVANQQKAFDIRLRLFSSDENNVEYRRLLAMSYLRLGDALSAKERAIKGADFSAQIIDDYRQSLSMLETIAAAVPEAKNKYMLAVLHQRLGKRYGEPPDGSKNPGGSRLELAERETARGICHPLAQAEPGNLQYQRCFVAMTADVAQIKFELGEDTKAALEDYKAAVSQLERLSNNDPSNTELRRDLAQNYKTSAKLYEQAGDRAGAINAGREAIKIFESLMQADAARVNDTRPDLIDAYQTLSRLLRKSGDQTGASEYERKASTLTGDQRLIK